MDKIDLTKKVASFIVGTGATKIVGTVIRNNVSPEKITDKVTVISASIVLGAMVKDATKVYTDAKIDEAAAFYHEHIEPRLNKSDA